MPVIEDRSSGLPTHPEVHYEHTDVDGRKVIRIGAGLLIGAWIFTVLLYFFFNALMQRRTSAGPPLPARAQGRTFEPPEPRIQGSPRADLQAMRAWENSQLTGYAWVDRSKGIVSIPVDRAIGIIARRGIPPQKAPADLKLYPPQAGTRETGFEGKVEPEPR